MYKRQLLLLLLHRSRKRQHLHLDPLRDPRQVKAKHHRPQKGHRRSPEDDASILLHQKPLLLHPAVDSQRPVVDRQVLAAKPAKPAVDRLHRAAEKRHRLRQGLLSHRRRKSLKRRQSRKAKLPLHQQQKLLKKRERPERYETYCIRESSCSFSTCGFSH